MKILTIALMPVLFINPLCDIEHGWKGIKVYVTSRGEVESILGKQDRYDGEATYDTPEAVVHVRYTSTTCSGLSSQDEKLKRDTVRSYRVILKKDLRLLDIVFQEDAYEKTEDKHQLGFTYYDSREKGVLITTNRPKDGAETVRSLTFEPSKAQTLKYRACK